MDYEYAEPLTAGGTAATYQVNSPWNDPNCELAVLVLSFAALGGVSLTDGLPIAVTDTTTFNTDSPFRGMVINSHTATTIHISDYFFPIPTGRFQMQVTGGPVLAVLQWRRPKRAPLTADLTAIYSDPSQQYNQAREEAQVGPRTR